VDAAGNSISCSYVVSVIDNTAPVAEVCPTDIEQDNDAGVCGAVITYDVPVFSDNCDGDNLSGTLVEGLASGAEFPIGTTTVTYSYTDAAGNTTICSFDVTINDTENPVIVCPANVEVDINGAVTAGDATIVSSGPCGVTLSYTEPIGTDNCDGAITSLEGGQGGAANYYQYGGVYTETWMVTDASGNTDECSFTITVADPVPPTITCPVDFTVNNDPGVCGAVVNYSFPIETDNCPGWTVSLTQGLASGSVFPVGTTTVEFTITDDAGNSTTCDFDVTVEDTEAPVIDACPADRSITTSSNGLADCTGMVPDLTGEVGASDNCTATADLIITQSPAAGSSFGAAHGDEQVVTITVTDAEGNASTCEVVLTLEDDEDPVIDCSQINTDRVADAGLCSFTMPGAGFDPNFADNCSATISHNYPFAPNTNTLAGATFPVGSTTVVWTATDANGNTADCTITINVADEEDPIFLNCPTEMIMVGNDPDECSAKVNWAIPVATDNCGIQSVEQIAGPAAGSEIPVCELTTITYEATDVHGNTATCSFDVLVIDTQDPQVDDDIVMPADMTVECDAIPAAFVLTNDDVNDNCTDAADLVIEFTETDTQDPDEAECGHYEYTITRTWTVTDEACALGGGENVYTHVQVIDVEDTTPPEAVCQNVTISLDLFGNASINATSLDGGSTDNCAPASVLDFEASQTDFDCDDLGPNNVTLTVTDPCGNVSTCVAVVTVLEGIAPCVPEYDIEGSAQCECLDNATDLLNGQFGESIQIEALAGQTWSVVTSSGLFDINSPAPPASPVSIANGTVLTVGNTDGLDNDGDGDIDEFDEQRFYILEAVHVDAIGYSAVLSNGQGDVLNLSTTCYYPTPIFDNLFGPYCLSTDPFEIEVSDLYGGDGVIAEIFVNGEATNIFDAAALGIGIHEVEVVWDAGTATPYQILNGEIIDATNQEALQDPGCRQPISMIVEVVGTPDVVACNDLVQVSIEGDCESVITPDMVLEGTYFCFDDYEVILDYPSGTNTYDPPNTVDGSHAGYTIGYTLFHSQSGNLCWGEVQIEDKLDPVVTCPDDVTLLCSQDEDDLLLTGQPTIDDCTATTTEYFDDFEQFDCAENAALAMIITRTFVVTDAFENQSSCTQVIEVTRPELDEVVFPQEVTMTCVEAGAGTDPDQTGWPQWMGSDLTPSTIGGCGLAVSYTDQLVPGCNGSYTIKRVWIVIDQCPENGGGTQDVEFEQFINVNDVDPTIELPGFLYDPVNDWYTISANEYSDDVYDACVAIGPLPLATVTDACNEVVHIEVATSEGTTTNGGMIPQPGLPEGVHQVTYIAEDECGNITELTVNIRVIDDIAPIAICDEITDVDVTSDGLAIVPATVFDDGSYDNCCLDELLVRRMDGDCEGNFDEFGPTVEFCCSDVGQDPVMVVFRAVDCNGNYNECMVTVEVNDKLPPINTFCPAPVTIDCETYLEELDSYIQAEDYSVLDQYGTATFIDNCDLDIEYVVTPDLDQCASGTITRVWTAEDPSENSPSVCSQTITIEHISDWVVEFPEDVTANCEDGELPEFGEPIIFFDECELIGTAYEDSYFYVVPDACYKIERTWTVINWCIYDEIGENLYVEYPECDVFPPFTDWDGDGDSDCRTFRDGYNDSAPTGTAGEVDGYIQYVQVIKVQDTEAPIFDVTDFEVCIEETDCDTDVTLPTPDVDDCSTGVEITVFSDDMADYATGDQYVYADVPPGDYQVFYEVIDDCGNISYDDIIVTVKDCKLPTPYCVDGLVIEIMQTGMIDVWAADFDAGSFDNCPGDLTLSFSDDPADDQRLFDCEDLGENVIQLWVTDAAGNQDFCETFVEIQDNMGHCDTTGMIVVAGLIATEGDEAVENVMVEVNGTGFMQTTGVDGTYEFTLPAGQDYTITPMLDEDADNGVTTFDLVLITRHILGIELLDSPYKIIAADANNSQSVTTFDMVLIRRVILQIDQEFQNNTSWRFVDKDYVFPNQYNPWEEIFPEVLSYNNLSVDDLNADFVGVKIGDVNGTAQANSDMQAAEDRRTGALFFRTEDRSLEADEIYTIDFTAPATELMGYQYTLEFDAKVLDLIEVEPAIAGPANFGLTYAKEGAVTTSWNSDGLPIEFSEGEVVFSLTFRALKDAALSDLLNISSRYTKAEAYHATEGRQDVFLTFHSNWPGTEFALYQNVPNPFDRVTTVGFYLPQQDEINLQIRDVRGALIQEIQGTFAKGYNELVIRDLDAAEGVLFYTLRTRTNEATKQMVLQK
jgi:hypothetical protein